MAFCRQVKQAKRRVVFFDGQDVAACRMYTSFEDVWKGFSKNIAEGVGGGIGVIAVALLYFATFVAPYLALAASIVWPTLLWPAAVGVAANLLIRAVGVVRNQQPAEGLVTHPLGAIVLIAIALNSLRWSRSGTIAWRDRVYATRDARLQQSENA